MKMEFQELSGPESQPCEEVQSVRTSLPKHVYPPIIHVFLIVLPLIWLAATPVFLFDILPTHRAVYAQLKQADSAFAHKQYEEVIALYGPLIDTYPEFKKGKIVLAKSFFALCAEYDSEEVSEELYEIGLSCLNEAKYSVSEISIIKDYVPQKYKNFFDEQFTWIST